MKCHFYLPYCLYIYRIQLQRRKNLKLVMNFYFHDLHLLLKIKMRFIISYSKDFLLLHLKTSNIKRHPAMFYLYNFVFLFAILSRNPLRLKIQTKHQHRLNQFTIRDRLSISEKGASITNCLMGNKMGKICNRKAHYLAMLRAWFIFFKSQTCHRPQAWQVEKQKP